MIRRIVSRSFRIPADRLQHLVKLPVIEGQNGYRPEKPVLVIVSCECLLRDPVLFQNLIERIPVFLGIQIPGSASKYARRTLVIANQVPDSSRLLQLAVNLIHIRRLIPIRHNGPLSFQFIADHFI